MNYIDKTFELISELYEHNVSSLWYKYNEESEQYKKYYDNKILYHIFSDFEIELDK